MCTRSQGWPIDGGVHSHAKFVALKGWTKVQAACRANKNTLSTHLLEAVSKLLGWNRDFGYGDYMGIICASCSNFAAHKLTKHLPAFDAKLTHGFDFLLEDDSVGVTKKHYIFFDFHFNVSCCSSIFTYKLPSGTFHFQKKVRNPSMTARQRPSFQLPPPPETETDSEEASLH